MKVALRLLIPTVVMLVVLGLSAGRFDVWWFWAWVGTLWALGGLTYVVLGRVNPGLVDERMKPPSDRDRATRRLVMLPFLSLLVVSGLDVRLGWSEVPLAAQLVGLSLTAAALLLVAWVLFTNPFASSAVRVQQERGHSVITTGPYRLVRHPMYLAVVLICLGSGPALGSWFSGLALVPVLAIFVRRTLLEDRMLRAELEGYAAYSQQVRWRIIPLVF